MSQEFKHTYQDDFLEVTLEAQNDEHSWANIQDLTKALLDIVKCVSDWKKFELYVVIKEQKNLHGNLDCDLNTKDGNELRDES